MRKKVELKNGTKVLIRNLREDDVGRSLAFFKALPPEERIYLRNNVTRRKVVTERINLMKTGRVKRLVAVADDRIVADGSLETEGFAWKDHVAELRLIVAPEFQRQGAGHAAGPRAVSHRHPQAGGRSHREGHAAPAGRTEDRAQAGLSRGCGAARLRQGHRGCEA